MNLLELKNIYIITGTVHASTHSLFITLIISLPRQTVLCWSRKQKKENWQTWLSSHLLALLSCSAPLL